MKTLRLPLPPEVAGLVASARRCPDPPEAAREELRARLGWAFTQGGPAKVVYAPEHTPLQSVPAAATRPAPRDGWLRFLARAAAAMVLGHVPLALASLGVAVAAVPVSRFLLNRVAESRVADHPASAGGHHVAHLPATAAAPRGSPTQAPPSLPPPPALFPVEEPLEPAPQIAPQALAVSRVTPQVRSETPNDDLALAAERQLLEQARRALMRGDGLGALAILNEHGARYPGSQLAEEREALSVQALLRSGRTGEARLRGIEFRRQYPNSMLLRALGAALHE